MPQPRKVVTSFDLAARAVARQSRPRPWAQSQPKPSCIRNRPALQPETPSIPKVEQTPEPEPAKPKANGRRVHWDDTANTIKIIPARFIPAKSKIPILKKVTQKANSTGPSTGRTSQRQPGARKTARQPQSTTTLKRPAAQLSYVSPARTDRSSVSDYSLSYIDTVN